MDVNTLRATLRKQPFQAFTIRLVDGREYLVKHPDFVAVSPRTVVVIDSETEAVTVLEPVLIISLEGLRNGETARSSPAG
jgi:hypothetical protein